MDGESGRPGFADGCHLWTTRKYANNTATPDIALLTTVPVGKHFVGCFCFEWVPAGSQPSHGLKKIRQSNRFLGQSNYQMFSLLRICTFKQYFKPFNILKPVQRSYMWQLTLNFNELWTTPTKFSAGMRVLSTVHLGIQYNVQEYDKNEMCTLKWDNWFRSLTELNKHCRLRKKTGWKLSVNSLPGFPPKYRPVTEFN